MNIITISIVVSIVSILAIGAISTNLVVGQVGPGGSQGPMGTSQGQGPMGTSQGQGNINAHGSGLGCGTAHCSHDPLGVGGSSGYTGGYGFGGTYANPEYPSGIESNGGGAGYGQYTTEEEGTLHCGEGGGGAFDVFTGEPIGAGGGGSCSR